MATLEEIRAARAADMTRRTVLGQIQAARAADRVFTPDGRSTAPGTTEAQAAEIPPGMIYDQATGTYRDAGATAQKMGGMQGASANYLSGTPFVGQYADEAIGKVDGLFGGNPEYAQEVFRQSKQQFQDKHPVLATGAQLAGGVVGSLPAVGMIGATGVAAEAGSLVGGAARVIGGGALLGGSEGLVSGYGAGTTPQDRNSKAASGTAFGALAGGVVGAVAPLLGKTAAGAYRAIKKLDVSAIAHELGLSKPAARIVRDALLNDDLAAASDALAKSGDGSMLADAGEATGNLLDMATSSGGKALATARPAVEARAKEAGIALNATLDKLLGPPQGVRAASTAISKRTAAVRQAAYDAAYASPINYADDTGRAIERVLNRVAPKDLNAAVEIANNVMRDGEIFNKQIMAQITDQGVTFKTMPDVLQLDKLKQGLAAAADKLRDPTTGRITSEGRTLQRQARDLNKAIADAVPDYSRAVRLGGDKLAEERALDLGTNILSNKVSVEDVADIFKGSGNALIIGAPSVKGGASVAERNAVATGVRTGIERALSQVRAVASDPNTDAREASKLIQDLSSRANHEKISLALGGRAPALFKAIDEATAAIALRGTIARNSATAIRTSTRAAAAEQFAPGPLRRIAAESGDVIGGLKQISREALLRKMPEKQLNEALAEIAGVLTSMRGKDAQKALFVVKKAMAGQPATDAMAEMVARVAGTATFIGFLQGSQKLLPH